jgi:hypothetical protein
VNPGLDRRTEGNSKIQAVVRDADTVPTPALKEVSR